MKEIVACPVCESQALRLFLTRESVPVHQNLTITDQQRALNVARGDLRFEVCEDCAFVFNRAFDLGRLSYDERYDNTQTYSRAFDAYLSQLVDYLVDERQVRGCRIVEVGCGKGLFLRKLVEADGAGNSGHGFDPSYVGPLTDLDGRLNFSKSFYGSDAAGIPADVVVCRHVIEHVPDPIDLLRTIRQALAGSAHARVFFETPDVEWILRNRIVWDFFYEHCSIFTPASLTTAFETAGFSVESVRHVFGCQYLWLEARVAPRPPTVSRAPGATPALARQFAAAERELRQLWATKVEQLARKGRLALWGAGAKGVTLANLVDAQRRWIDAVVDLNPAKQGCYLPGTGHPIIDYTEMAARGITSAILMNPNYREENLALLRQARLAVDLIGEG